MPHLWSHSLAVLGSHLHSLAVQAAGLEVQAVSVEVDGDTSRRIAHLLQGEQGGRGVASTCTLRERVL